MNADDWECFVRRRFWLALKSVLRSCLRNELVRITKNEHGGVKVYTFDVSNCHNYLTGDIFLCIFLKYYYFRDSITRYITASKKNIAVYIL